MKPNEFKVFVGFMMLLMVILCIVSLFTGCDSGWSLCGWEVK